MDTKKTRHVTLATGILTLVCGILIGAAVYHGLCLLAGGPSIPRAVATQAHRG